MAWRIVKQPNGKLARFSDIADNFTHWNMTEKQALDLCRSFMGEGQAQEKVRAGIEDHKPWQNKVKGSGTDRWEDALETIEMQHGEKAMLEIKLALS